MKKYTYFIIETKVLHLACFFLIGIFPCKKVICYCFSKSTQIGGDLFSFRLMYSCLNGPIPSRKCFRMTPVK